MSDSRGDWTKVGEIGVDAGMCWIGDPCYVLHTEEKQPKAIGADWQEFCEVMDDGSHPHAKQFRYDLGHAGLGVCVSSGYGDGVYDVEAKFVEDSIFGRRIAEVRVVFIPDEERPLTAEEVAEARARD